MDVVWFAGWDVIVRTVIAATVTYAILIALLRLTGPRTLAKWYAFDLIITVALGSTFANGVLSKDISIAQAVAGFVLLVALQFAIGWLAVRQPRVLQVINPKPVLLLLDGELREEAMRSNRVTRADVCKALRTSGLADFSEASVVVLEPDGTFSVLERKQRQRTRALDDVPEYSGRTDRGGKPSGDEKSDESKPPRGSKKRAHSQ